VRNGFVPQVRREVASRFKGLEIDNCPFANLPEKKRTQWALTKEEMKNCAWLRPELVAQIEFTEWTPDGHLRHSKFVGLREDKGARDVVREGLRPQVSDLTSHKERVNLHRGLNIDILTLHSDKEILRCRACDGY
jgi:ATP-dependent DNA ligase